MKRPGLLWALLFSSAAALLGQPTVQAQDKSSTPTRPRLVVVIAIDQFRADYVTRFSDLYLPARKNGKVGGFRFLQERGAWYADCRYGYHRTATGVGHATLATGAQPGVHGIVGNQWWNRETRKPLYCTDDANTQVVGAQSGSKETPMSPANLATTTFVDELELATGGASRTVSVSLKDRASILLSGHRTDVAIWFDEQTGGWVSSRFYFKDGNLPQWVQSLNSERIPDKLRQEPWTPSVSEAALQRVWVEPGKPRTFSHQRTGSSYNAFTTSPAGNTFTFATARRAVEVEKLGQDTTPDILTMNLASNDYVGHRFGPDSAEVLDISVQTDRELSEFFNFLNEKVPGGLNSVVIAVSADHGVTTVPEVNSAGGVPVERAVSKNVVAAAEGALDAAFGPADWIASTENYELYFNDAAFAAQPKATREQAEKVAAEAAGKIKGVYFAVGKSAILSGKVPGTLMGQRLMNGVHPQRSGDVILVLQPGWLAGSAPRGTGTSHGQPFPNDTHIPLLIIGPGVRPGSYLDPVDPTQLAPSVSLLLGIPRPNAADSPLLPGLTP